MEQLPLTFVQSTVDPNIQECFRPAYNFTRINSSNGRLAFTSNKIYWLPDAPMALMDQGWVISVNEVDSCSKYGISGFIIKLVDGKELRFSNVGQKMRESIIEAIDSHKSNPVAEEPSSEAAPEAAPAEKAAPAETAPVVGVDSADSGSNKLMAVLAYFGILVLIPLFAAKDSKFARFHTNQGLILVICEIVAYIIGRIPGIAGLSWIISLAVFVLAVIGIINAVKGQTKELPLIGKFRIIQ